ncbi:uncharacterized protein CTRU02_215795 [Colletotrichum truncatum]|uniref:Uncharacterized protein n=1 Tax=Colletotrichum truncatum TaxID=5467 RepID=A0ACC3YBP5_COLTU
MLDQLPLEILDLILAQLSVADLASVVRVAHIFKDLGTPLMLPRAIHQDSHLIIDPNQLNMSCLISRQEHLALPLPLTLTIFASGRTHTIRSLVEAGAPLGHYKLPGCRCHPWQPRGWSSHLAEGGSDDSGTGKKRTDNSTLLQPSIATPLHIAARKGDTSTTAYLITKLPSDQVDNMAFRFCLHPSRHLDILRNHHRVWSRPEMPSATALHIALAYHADDELILNLIRSGAAWDVPLANSHGVSALHIMSANGRVSLLQKMADFGLAGMDWPDHRGLRALHYAVCWSPTRMANCLSMLLVQALVRVGAKLDSSDGDDAYDVSAYASRLISCLANGYRGARAMTQRPWLPTDYLLPSGAVVDADQEMFSNLPTPPRLLDFALREGKPALADAIWAAQLRSTVGERI